MVGRVERKLGNDSVDRVSGEQVAHERRATRRDAPGGDETSCEPPSTPGIQRVVAYAPSAAARVNDAPLPRVNRDVADAFAGLGEQDQIARLERGPSGLETRA